MQIEAGKSYKNRRGEIIGPMAINPDEPTLCGVKGGGLDDYYVASGSSYSDGREHPSDLIEVYVDPVNQVTVKNVSFTPQDAGSSERSWQERERELLEANTRYLEAGRAVKTGLVVALEEIERYKREVADLHKEADRLAAERNEWQDKAITAETDLDRVANRSDEERGMVWLLGQLGAHRRHLEAVIPYAESRVEDMEETKDNAQDEVDNCDLDDKDRRNHLIGLRDDAKAHHDKALNAVVEAKRFMGLA